MITDLQEGKSNRLIHNIVQPLGLIKTSQKKWMMA